MIADKLSKFESAFPLGYSYGLANEILIDMM